MPLMGFSLATSPGGFVVIEGSGIVVLSRLRGMSPDDNALSLAPCGLSLGKDEAGVSGTSTKPMAPVDLAMALVDGDPAKVVCLRPSMGDR